MIKEQIRDYYRSLTPAPGTSARLVDLAGAAPDAVPHAALRAAGAQRWRVAALLATAAAIAAFVIGYGAGRRGAATSGVTADGASSGQSPGPAIALTDGPAPASTRPSLEPRLVLFKMHADWCPRSPKVAPIFQELGEKFANEPVLFVTFDITDPPRQRQAMLLAQSLGILDQIGDHRGEMIRMEPGLIRLVDRHAAEIVSTLRERGEQPDFEAALAHALPRKPRAEP